MSDARPTVAANPWQTLRKFTAARIALGRAGVSLPTEALLEFQLAHAQARDAVHLPLDLPALRSALVVLAPELIALKSAAPDRDSYLQRPDLGRRLDAASRAVLNQRQPAADVSDVVFVVADGLSALAVNRHAAPLLERALPQLRLAGWSVGPLVLVEQGRVAVGDEIGQLLGARTVVVLIGERPGLSSPDSLGIYLSWMPRPGLTDASRNCISNIRPAGLGYDDAARKLIYLLTEARRLGLSGVGLKDAQAPPGAISDAMPAATSDGSFLLPER